MKNVKAAEFKFAAKIKHNLARVVNEVADRLNESVEQDKLTSLVYRKEKLELEKMALLARLEQVEKDLYQTRTELEKLTVGVEADLVTV